MFFCNTFERVRKAILGKFLESRTVLMFVRPRARRRARLMATARVRPIAHPDAAVDVVLRHEASGADVLLRSWVRGATEAGARGAPVEASAGVTPRDVLDVVFAVVGGRGVCAASAREGL